MEVLEIVLLLNERGENMTFCLTFTIRERRQVLLVIGHFLFYHRDESVPTFGARA